MKDPRRTSSIGIALAVTLSACQGPHITECLGCGPAATAWTSPDEDGFTHVDPSILGASVWFESTPIDRTIVDAIQSSLYLRDASGASVPFTTGSSVDTLKQLVTISLTPSVPSSDLTGVHTIGFATPPDVEARPLSASVSFDFDSHPTLLGVEACPKAGNTFAVVVRFSEVVAGDASLITLSGPGLSGCVDQAIADTAETTACDDGDGTQPLTVSFAPGIASPTTGMPLTYHGQTAFSITFIPSTLGQGKLSGCSGEKL